MKVRYKAVVSSNVVFYNTSFVDLVLRYVAARQNMYISSANLVNSVLKKSSTFRCSKDGAADVVGDASNWIGQR